MTETTRTPGGTHPVATPTPAGPLATPTLDAGEAGGPPAASGGPLGSDPSLASAAGSELGGAMISAGSAPIASVTSPARICSMPPADPPAQLTLPRSALMRPTRSSRFRTGESAGTTITS